MRTDWSQPQPNRNMTPSGCNVFRNSLVCVGFFFLVCFFVNSRVTCVRIMKLASRPWHTQACVMGDNFPPRCVPGGAHTHLGSQRRTRLRHTVPHAAMLFPSHDARQQMAVWRQGENNCAHARQPPTRFSTSEPSRHTRGHGALRWSRTVNQNVTKPQCGFPSVFYFGFFCKVVVVEVYDKYVSICSCAQW